MPEQPEPTVRSLIEIQTRLAKSPNRVVQRIGTWVAAGVLERRMASLTDRQIGQLMFDYVGRDLGIVQPEATILQHGTQRLFRSTGDRLTAEEMKRQQERRSCPRCGNEMLRRYGIDEPDFRQCVSLACAYKELIAVTKKQRSSLDEEGSGLR